MLKFFGRGSAFADEHNSAFFVHDNDLILIDCPATTFQKIKKMKGLSEFENIFILVTHTHGDHSGGLGTMLQYVWFVLNKKVTVVAPSEQVKSDLNMLLMQIEGCEERWFNITTTNKLNKDWLISAVATTHVIPLISKCFGYHLRINNTDVVYTGDSATLEPFVKLLKNGSYLYTEIASVNSRVHLYIDDVLPELIRLTENGIRVYLMHIDDELKISEKIKNTAIEFAPLES